MTKPIPIDRLPAARHVVSRMLGLRPGHACEAVAASLGYNTHAALGAALRAKAQIPRTPDARRFRTRLAELGHEVPAASAEACLAVSFGIVPKGASDREATTRLLRTSNCVAAAWMEVSLEQPAASDMLLALRPVPDARVATMTIGKDTLGWNPDFVRSLLFEELKLLLAAAALHRAAAHPLRIGERDPDTWRVACDYVVNHFLVDAQVGELPKCGYYDKRFPSDMPAEDVYERLVGESHRLRGASLFDFEAWKARAPATPPTVAEAAAGKLERRYRHDAFDLPEFDFGSGGWGPARRSVSDAVRGFAPEGTRKDARSASFGRHLARMVADLPERERARAVSEALGQVRGAYMSACFDDLLKGVHPEPRG